MQLQEADLTIFLPFLPFFTVCLRKKCILWPPSTLKRLKVTWDTILQHFQTTLACILPKNSLKSPKSQCHGLSPGRPPLPRAALVASFASFAASLGTDGILGILDAM